LKTGQKGVKQTIQYGKTNHLKLHTSASNEKSRTIKKQSLYRTVGYNGLLRYQRQIKDDALVT